MKNWSTQNKLLIIIAIVLISGSIFMLTTILLPRQKNMSNAYPSPCSTMSEKLNDSNNLQFHPLKIVAEPWRGEHNVYAIFALPLQYQDIADRSRLLVKGSDTPWNLTPINGLKYGMTTPEGHFLVIGFFRTRLALWYWARGRFGDLQQPCNWTLHLFIK
ncbi:MAG: hypothetical protein LH649_03350 [Pseudanabaena sp. CAN_BIN31]|nr:hypothetical protein [Pseudanabaena sp. CAN_BIN31]